MRVGVGQRIGHTLRVPGRGLRRLAVVLVVLVLAGATGSAISLSAPTLLDGLHAAPEPAAPPPPRMLGPLPATAPLPSAAGLASLLGPKLAAAPGTLSGVVIDPASGRTLWQQGASTPLLPGSTGKLITASAVLLTMSATSVLTTKVVAGADPGTIVLVGGGDPTLTALPPGKTGIYPDPARLTDLAAQVKKAVPGPITKLVLDTSRYQGPTLAPGWMTADIAGGNITPIVPLMLDGGREDPAALDGPRVAEPAMVAGQAFADLLGVDPGAITTGTAPADAKVLGSVSSAPIADLIETMLTKSDNVLAEVLARETAIQRGGEATFTGAVQQTMAALGQAGIDTTGTSMVDGSGLSTQDRVPAAVLGAVLTAAAAPAQGPRDTEFLRPILTGLPVAGGDGTLDDRFVPGLDSAAGRGVVRAKTGTLNEASALAGVVTDDDHRLLVFAFMSNGVLPAKARPLLDDLAAALSGCGCR